MWASDNQVRGIERDEVLRDAESEWLFIHILHRVEELHESAFLQITHASDTDLAEGWIRIGAPDRVPMAVAVHLLGVDIPSMGVHDRGRAKESRLQGANLHGVAEYELICTNTAGIASSHEALTCALYITCYGRHR